MKGPDCVASALAGFHASIVHLHRHLRELANALHSQRMAGTGRAWDTYLCLKDEVAGFEGMAGYSARMLGEVYELRAKAALLNRKVGAA